MIRKYEGQPLAAGMIVCRQSIMNNGFASMPYVIARMANSQALVVDARYANDTLRSEQRVAIHTIAYICDTIEEGNEVAKASRDFVTRENEIAKEHARALADRRAAIIADLLGEGA